MKHVPLLFILSLILVACSSAQAISIPTQPSRSDAGSNPTAVLPTAASAEANPTSTQTSEDSGQPSTTGELARIDEQGAVVVEVTPVNLADPGESIEFDIGMNTHSVDLSMDLAALSTLSTNTGKTVLASRWDAPSGGHHVSGKLIFPAAIDGQLVLDDVSELTLTIKDLDAAEHIFSWDLSE